MESGKELTLAMLAKKIDDQARFSRAVTIICTLAILGVLFYTLTEIFNGLPQAVVMHYMANMEPIVKEWKLATTTIERSDRVREAKRDKK